MKIARVSLDSTLNMYDFFTDLELVAGDAVVCDTVRGLAIGEVIDVVNTSKKANKWVVQKIDMSQHESRLAREKRIKELQAQMEDRRKNLEQEAIYAMLAKEDAEMSAMLKEYKDLLE